MTKVVETASIIPYSTQTKIGTGAKGSGLVTGVSELPEGCYRLYVRGVDKGGIKGTGKGVTIHVDSTKPTLSSATITKSSESAYSKNLTPLISWSGAKDSHLRQVEYSINGGTYEKMGTSENGSFTIPSGKITKSGVYNIYVRAVDKAGNVSSAKTLPYYCDKDVPVLKATVEHSGTAYTSVSTPKVTWSVTDNSFKQIEYSINSTTNYELLSKSKSWNYTPLDMPMGTGQVESSAGNFYYQTQDIKLPSMEVDFSVNRVYNSQSGIRSLFGYGWDANFSTQLYHKKDGSVVLKDSTGNSFTFKMKDGNYELVGSNDYELILDEANFIIINEGEKNEKKLAVAHKYIVEGKGTYQYYYNASGQLKCIVESNGTYLLYEYDITGKLVSLQSSGSKKIELQYDDELINSIHLPDNTTLSYEYDDGYLKKVTHFNANKSESVSYCYEYDGVGRLSGIYDAQGNLYEIKYDGSERVEGLTYPNQDKMVFDYSEAEVTIV